MSEVSRTPLSDGLGMREQRERFFRATLLAGMVTSVFAFVLFLVLWLVNRQFPGNYLAPIVVALMVVSGFCLWLQGRGRLGWAVGLFFGGLVVAFFAIVFFTGGVSGPMATVLLLVPVVASLVGGGRVAGWVAVALGVFYLAMILLEAAEIVVPWAVSGDVAWWLYAGIFVVGLVAVTFLALRFSSLIEASLEIAYQRGRQLADAEQQARQAAQAERKARLEQERTVGRLRVAIRRYLAFLERVSEGDREVRLDLDDEQEGVLELRVLGEYLNRTVDALTGALGEMELVQRRYTAEAWGTFAAGGGSGLEFAYDDGQVTLAGPDEGWMPLMQRAVQQGDVVVDGPEVAIPFVMGGEVIGVLGAVKESGWGRDDLTVMRAAILQLAQTVETLRLLDQTQRGALRERAIGQVAGRVRQELNVEGVLRAAVDEIQQVLGVERVTLRMVEQHQE